MRPDPTPIWRRFGDGVILWVIATLLVLSWFSHGHVEPGWPRFFGWLCVALVGAWGIIGWMVGEWDRRELIPAKILIGMLALAVGVGYLQTLPLPANLVASLSSPWRTHLRAMEGAGLQPPTTIPIALAPERAMAATQHLLAALLFFIGVVMLATRRRAAKWLLVLVALYGVLEGLTGLVHWLMIGRGRAHGAIYNPNHWAAAVVAGSMVAACGVYTWARRSLGSSLEIFGGRSPLVLLFLPVGAALVGWLAALSRGSLLAVCAVLLVWIAVEWKGRRDGEHRGRLAIGIPFLLMVCLVSSAGMISIDRLLLRFHDMDILTANSRVQLWWATLAGWREAPLVGLGYGGSEFAINRFAGFALVSLPVWSHNDPLQWFCEWGLLFALPIVSLFCWFLYMAIRLRRERQRYMPFTAGLMNRACLAALAVLLLHSFFDFHLRIPVVGWMSLMLLALGLQSGSYFGRSGR